MGHPIKTSAFPAHEYRLCGIVSIRPKCQSLNEVDGGEACSPIEESLCNHQPSAFPIVVQFIELRSQL